MKFTSAVLALASVITAVSAGPWTSPADGAALYRGEPFAFNFTSYKYAKETSSSVTLAIRPANSSSTDLLILAENLKASSSVGGSWANYLQDAVYPQFFYGDSDGAKKSYDLVIVETYNSYGGGKAISSKEKITVTFEQK